jgi:hypothetical protein
MLAASSATASFDKGEHRWIGLSGGFNAPGRIEIGSDGSYFYDIDPLEEFRELFSRIALPSQTLVMGDVEQRLDPAIGIFRRSIWKSGYVQSVQSNKRLRKFGFFWIDQFTPLQWKVLCQLSPIMENRVISLIDDTRIVLMWDSPYEHLEASKPMLLYAKKIAGISSD